MSYLSKFIPGLANRDDASIDDVENMPTEEEIEQAHKEGKRFWFELSGEEKRRYRRAQSRAEIRQRSRANRGHRRRHRAERIRKETLAAQIRVLEGPDTPMKANVLAALNVAQEAAERPTHRQSPGGVEYAERVSHYTRQNALWSRPDAALLTPRQEKRTRQKLNRTMREAS